MGQNSYRQKRAANIRRSYILIGVAAVVLIAAVIGLIIVLRGRGDRVETTPTAQVAEVGSTPTASLALDAPAVEAPVDTPTPAATATLEPYQHTVASGETLFYIIQLYGYRDLDVLPELLDLNSMISENDPLTEGELLLIPRQTPTPGAEPQVAEEATSSEGEAPAENDGELAEDAIDYSNCNLDNRCISPDGQYWIHIVQENETVAGLAYQYETRVSDIQDANGITDIIYLEQQLRIPILITLTPTLTPTGGPDATPTPLPDEPAPSLLSPSDGFTIPRGQAVILQWVANRALQDNNAYLITIRNSATGDEIAEVTRSNALRVPAELQPGVGAAITYTWSVTIIASENPTASPVSSPSEPWSFTWGGS